MKQFFMKIILIIFFCFPAYSYEIISVDNDIKSSYGRLIDEAMSLLPEKISHEISSNLFFKLEKNISHAGSYQNNTIILNEDLFREFVVNPYKSKFVKFTRHPDLKTYLIASLLHEVAHEYDNSKFDISEFVNGRELQAVCNQNIDYGNTDSVNPHCLTKKVWKGRISGDPEFLNLIYFYFYGKTPTERARGNFLETRSVDPYEFKSPEEAFAVNFEFFVLDKNFKCQKPGLYKYLSRRMNTKPFESIVCNDYPVQYYISPQVGEKEFKPKIFRPQGKLYQVHYFMAGKGAGTASRFGHAMLRLVYCDPQIHPNPTEDCMYDVDQHIIISPAAGVTEMDMSMIDGLNGKYTTALFGNRLSQMTVSYNRVEEREIFSFPLNINQEQLKSLEQSILEAHWGYQNKYYFMTNNCAVEVLNMIKRAIPENFALQSSFETIPTNLFEILQKLNLISNKPLNDWRNDRSGRFYFASEAEYLDSLESYLFQNLQIEKVKSYRKLNIEERTQIVELVKNSEKNEKLSITLIYLEKNIQMKLSLEIMKKITVEIMKNKKDEKSAEFQNFYARAIAWMSSSEVLGPSHYGLPSSIEVSDVLSTSENDRENMLRQGKEFLVETKRMKTQYSEYQEFEKINQLLKGLLIHKEK